jgi:hypothetical protein
VVLSHRLPEQVARLARAILASSPRSRVLVEHDARHGPPPLIGDDRVAVRTHGLAADWGSWELAEAGLAGLRRARDHTDAELVVLVSGQDYPARRLADWEQQVCAGDVAGLVPAAPLAYRPHWGRRPGEGQDDLTRYSYRWWPAPGRYPPRAVTTMVKASRYVEPAVAWRVLERGRGNYVGLRRRPDPFPATRPCWKGSQWVALRRPLLHAVLAQWDADPALQQVFRGSLIADEAVVPTLAHRSGLPIGDSPVSYADWSRPGEAPAVLSGHDLSAVLASQAPFCRKVEPTRSSALMAALDGLTSAD